MVPTACSPLVRRLLMIFVILFNAIFNSVFAVNRIISTYSPALSTPGSSCNKPQFTYVPAFQRCCRVCPSGSGIIRRCTTDISSECAPCSPGYYSDISDHEEGCHRCPVCQANSHQVNACSAVKPTYCECNAGYFYNSTNGICEKCSSCLHGFGAVVPCTALRDTMCDRCTDGSFSDIIAIDSPCQRCANCTGKEELMKPCIFETNSVCEGEQEDPCLKGLWYFYGPLMGSFILYVIFLTVQYVVQLHDLSRLQKLVATLAAIRKDDTTSQLTSPLTAKEANRSCTSYEFQSSTVLKC